MSDAPRESTPIDLRSDTVTRPTPAMRRAMAEAVVGDDVFDDDPTLHALQERVAGLLGKEAALFVVSGTMGNQLAVRSQVAHGDEILLERDCHIFNYEVGGAAALSGAQIHALPGRLGALEPAQVVAAVRPPEIHNPTSRLLCLENTHNRAGGVVIPLDRLAATANAATERGMRVHLDGARLWNAAVATGVPLARWAEPFDTVMMCFSKGLGAPVGSILAGDAETIARARRLRKMLGGGIRQGGILAAACLHALDHHVDRLADDHRRARRLAELAQGAPGLDADPARVHTNIVMIDITDPTLPAEVAVQRMRQQGVWISAYGPQRVRAVTHLDVDDAAIERAGSLLRGLCAPAGQAA
ncbi:MAG: GntG family PLP-dependent aldolase [Candidatus Eisenbacteria bacterium]